MPGLSCEEEGWKGKEAGSAQAELQGRQDSRGAGLLLSGEQKLSYPTWRKSIQEEGQGEVERAEYDLIHATVT